MIHHPPNSSDRNKHEKNGYQVEVHNFHSWFVIKQLRTKTEMIFVHINTFIIGPGSLMRGAEIMQMNEIDTVSTITMAIIDHGSSLKRFPS
jgi:hypothetical protein